MPLQELRELVTAELGLGARHGHESEPVDAGADEARRP